MCSVAATIDLFLNRIGGRKRRCTYNPPHILLSVSYPGTQPCKNSRNPAITAFPAEEAAAEAAATLPVDTEGMEEAMNDEAPLVPQVDRASRLVLGVDGMVEAVDLVN